MKTAIVVGRVHLLWTTASEKGGFFISSCTIT